MKNHKTLYIVGAGLLLIGGYLYMTKKSADKTNYAPPIEEETTDTGTSTPTPTTTGGTLSGASQVLDSLKSLIAEIKTKKQNTATLPTIPKVAI